MLASLAQHVKHTEHALTIAYNHPLRAVLLRNFQSKLLPDSGVFKIFLEACPRPLYYRG